MVFCLGKAVGVVTKTCALEPTWPQSVGIDAWGVDTVPTCQGGSGAPLPLSPRACSPMTTSPWVAAAVAPCAAADVSAASARPANCQECSHAADPHSRRLTAPKAGPVGMGICFPSQSPAGAASAFQSRGAQRHSPSTGSAVPRTWCAMSIWLHSLVKLWVAGTYTKGEKKVGPRGVLGG